MLLKPSGMFDLELSDNFCGSYIKKEDLKKVIGNTLFPLKYITRDDGLFIDERDIHKNWKFLTNSKIKNSFDELVLEYIIKKTYPEAKVTTQYKVGKFHMDLKIEYKSKEFFIEFDSPMHFSLSKFGVPKDPRIKRDKIEKETGIKVINWPFWIQRCSKNVESIITGCKGKSALWSSAILFEDFCFPDSAQIIDEFSNNFKCSESYGNMYEKWEGKYNKEEHPIILQIKNDNNKLYKLFPKGSQKTLKWVPESLINIFSKVHPGVF
jgi:hypothetical protein